MGAEFEKQVSVIMGVYNQWNREALQKAVKSILNQTLTDFEFIIYDDGSDPEVAGYIRELEKLDERIVLIGKEENHGFFLKYVYWRCKRKIHCPHGCRRYRTAGASAGAV